MIRKALLCTAAAVLAVALACSKSTTSPASPSTATPSDGDAAADGSTLKATTPGVVSPTGGTQVTDPVTLTASKAAGKYQDVPLSYQFQVRSGSTVVYDSGVTGGVGSGSNVTHTVPGSALNSDTDYTWRVRAAYQGAVASWSADGAFKSPVGAFIRGNEVRDPLTIGRTVGEIRGATQFIPGVGLKLLTHESHVLYRLQQNLQQGEFSMMILGADEGSEGDKATVRRAPRSTTPPSARVAIRIVPTLISSTSERPSAVPAPSTQPCRAGSIRTSTSDRIRGRCSRNKRPNGIKAKGRR